MYAISGHYGTGKTVLASEAVKMILARLKETSKDVDVNVLTFGGSSSDMNYELLMKDLKNKWFNEQDVNIQHFADFLKGFTEEHKEYLNPKQLEEIRYVQKDKYLYGGETFNIVLIAICEMMKKFNKTSIIMIDEVNLNYTCRKTTENGKTSYHVDFSYLTQYDNIHFVICMRPFGYEVKDFNLIFPTTNQEGQLYQLLKKRHRNTIEILRFLIFYQKNIPQEKSNGYQSIDLEEILDEASLPPVLDPPGCGVIWIPCGMGFQEEQKALDKVKEIMTTLQGEPSVSILYRYGDNAKRLAENIFKANNQASWNGPYDVSAFNGTESNIIIYFCDGYLDIEAMSRPRQLLIIVSCGKTWNDPSSKYYAKIVKPMVGAVKQNLVRKVGDT